MKCEKERPIPPINLAQFPEVDPTAPKRIDPSEGVSRRKVDPWQAKWGWSRGGDVRERRLAKFQQNVARFRLYRLRFLQENMRFAAFFKIYQILKLKFLKYGKILQILRNFNTYFLLHFQKKC